MPRERYIAHVDMDAFFAAIEQRDNPKLRGKPVVIGADPKEGKGRGVVSTCSYEARKFGIHSAMPISQAYKRCPEAVFLGVDMEKYAIASQEIYKIFCDFTPDVEPISIDEAFLDITGSHHLFGGPHNTCLSIKEAIQKKTGLTASIGLAPIKMAAKIASDLKKPDGLVEVSKAGLLDFLWPLTVGKLWGLGKKTEAILNKMGIRTVGDLAHKNVEEIGRAFGKNGLHLWSLANGIDDRDVETEHDVKSVSNETTFGKDISDRLKIESALMMLSEKVSRRLRDDGIKGRTITLKIRLEGFITYTRAMTIDNPTNYTDAIYGKIKGLFDKFSTEGKKVRLVGVKVSNLSLAGVKNSLFEGIGDTKRENVHKAIDKIIKKFGEDAIHRAKYET